MNQFDVSNDGVSEPVDQRWTAIAVGYDVVGPVCNGELVASNESENEELKSVIRALREEIERLKSEIVRLNRDRDEKPPHYL